MKDEVGGSSLSGVVVVQSRGRRPAARAALTLIEVVVALAILGVIVALLLVALLPARESARRAACASNLRQLGIALNVYTTRHGAFPDGHGWNGFSAFVALLPDLEQRPLYNSINLEHSGILVPAENRTAARTSLSALACPSDSDNTVRYLEVPPISYAGNWGVGVQAFGYNGAFGSPFRRSTSAAQIRDGLGVTAGFSEWLVGMQGGAPNRPADRLRTVFRTDKEMTRPEQFEQFVAECENIDARVAGRGVPFSKGTNWLFGDFGFTMYNLPSAPTVPLARTATHSSKGRGPPAASTPKA